MPFRPSLAEVRLRTSVWTLIQALVLSSFLAWTCGPAAAAQSGTSAPNLSLHGLQASLKAGGHVESGNKLMDARRYAEAVKEYSRALELEPDNPRTLRLRSLAYLAQGQADPAGDDLRRALKLESDCPTRNSANACKVGQ